MTTSELYGLFLHHPKVTIDSRNCPKGSLFFALRGERFDGNQFAEKALSIGSAYAIIDNPDYVINERTILVENVLKTLQQLASRHRKAMRIPLIAITGSNGKTTTKELLAAVLSTKYNVLYTEGNLNTHIGVPLTLLRMNHEHEMAVIEMGARRQGEIKELAGIALPNYGIITNIGAAHLEGFGSYDTIVKTKGELYEYLRHTKGVIFIKKENNVLQAIGQGIEQVTYGEAEEAFVCGHVAGNTPYLTFDWKQQLKTHTVQTQLIGSYNLDNLLAAVAVGRYFKIPAERISRAIAAYQPDNNRSQYKESHTNHLIIDAYNANPNSMRAALENFAHLPLSPKAVILGDMKELGATSEELHRKVIEQIKSCHFDKVLLCGEQFSKTGSPFTTFASTEELIAALRTNPLKNHYILIKGSRSMALEKVAEMFDES
ncbi:MAG: UDP-N-acetylmuramoyl-tripeptide--D-alanyl-D-alanine ligase [Tannerellaceae bacterium]|jgi:UDP-N-acetylmuramoyl-tripeptide--D-alanyl-D-alanine ligase|nr:UDP-N-acetylmuramoyl-tripeptide--D-alanyl-D-alanine ligase [Tannerellaceae bacterium]